MNRLKYYTYTILIAFSLSGCDKDFDKVNTNPYALTNINPALLFANAQRLTSGGFYEAEQTVVQQFVNAYNLGATTGFNFNEDSNIFNVPRWNDNYPGPIKFLEQAIELVKDDPARSNLYSQLRIWRAYIFMTLVDTYGDVPYSEAGKAYIGGLYYPKYDKDEVIYEDLYNEIKTATAALSPEKDQVKEELFFGTSGSAAIQVEKWRKVGNSLLLRLGMRYSKLDPTKAASIVQEAFNGGVMASNSDNVMVQYNATYNNPLNAVIRTGNLYYFYLAEPFVNRLKSANDPRLKYISGKYAAPNEALALTPDTTAANQFGFPIGYDQTSVKNAPGYRGTAGTGQNYSQINLRVFGSATAPIFFVTNAQTKLLLAEASFRGWLPAGALTAQEYYNAGVKASMDEYSLYPTVPNPAIPGSTQDSYLNQPAVAYSAANALERINTQYWIASFGNGAESFANFRRSGYPALTPNNYNNNLQGGFVRRFAYPNEESARNSESYQAAVASFGPDNLTTRIFWDKP
ncbi:SusD-like starch-binding protein associating with outer membrane [Arcticibacter pallidicorallinus]|uniref:SusD-like starch-binding protein associating with outer membrane n=1 Tax=Arcticibacter pallidicorallinus TaxID=1259464 RepID=A0A2T0UC86_9SPHI|nr:SusD/RagB family nutrient-binding outer membrane lipoprotein [Arcticibacter pallidicorallinus]PRY55550.1 SusD-like starch-binding protein associating with outer membrane [Arcticibacter pallidicorallinus]